MTRPGRPSNPAAPSGHTTADGRRLELAERVDDAADGLAVRVVAGAIEDAEQRQLRRQGDAGVAAFAPPLVEQGGLAAGERRVVAVLADERVDGVDAPLLAGGGAV